MREAPGGRGPIVLLTGTPGSGKSSVAVALARRYRFGMHIPVDDLREWVVSGIAHPVPEWTEETGRQFALARAGAADLARRYAGAGFAVVIDDVIFPEEAEATFGEALRGEVLHRVVLRPRLEVALARNAARTTKTFDTAMLVPTIRALDRAMAEQPYAAMGWQVIDTSDLGTEETVDAILERLTGTR
jgi:chloramphenicol 3-O-phosphotransferase